MSIKIIVEQFNIFNDSSLDYSQNDLPFTTNYDIPRFQIRFYVKSPCYSENSDGDFQFSLKYRRQFKRIKNDFCKKFSPIYNNTSLELNEFYYLELANKTVKELQNTLQEKFVIPNSIEINTIELLGNWEVYRAPRSSALTLEAEEEYKNSIK